jgi:predicted enzyme related to lactoylglutathione lyase
MAEHISLATVILDCADPGALAEFYSTATGWPITGSDADWAYVGEGPVTVAFQRVEGYRGPAWPDPAKHAHLDFKAADPAAAVKKLVAAGATLPEFQPGGADWTVLTDPEGHPFCVSAG